MKILKYFAYAVAAVSLFTACERQDQEFVAQTVADPNMAKLQITRMVPEGEVTKAATDNRWWKVTIDDKDVWGDNYTYLGVRGIIPGAGYYYTLTPGTHNIKGYFYRNGEHTLAYETNVTLEAGQAMNAIIYDYSKDPLMHEKRTKKEYFVDGGSADVTHSTDPNHPSNASSYQMMRFLNLLYENENTGEPCDYKVQYYYNNPYNTNEWLPVGEPVGFGECTDWVKILINRYAPGQSYASKSSYGSNRNNADNRTGKTVGSGTCWIVYRAKKVVNGVEDENWLTYTFTGEGTSETRYADYWTATTGAYVLHILRGCRIANADDDYTGMYISQFSENW